MGKYNPYAQENMYRMDDEPPAMELNDYIAEYKRTGDEYWLACYLHRFEQTILNGWVYNQCRKYNQQSRFRDIKQEMIQALLEKLVDYDPTVGTTLIQFAGRAMVNSIHDYMRKNIGIYLLSDKYYQNLRKVNAIYYRNQELSHDIRIKTVFTETGLPIKKVLGYIDDGKWFRYPESIESNISDFELGKRTPNIYSSPEYIVLHDMFMSVYLEIIEKLRERDRQLFFDYLGIADFARRWVIDEKKIRLADIADKHQLRDEQSITNRYRKVVTELRAELEKQGWIEGENSPKLLIPVEKEAPALSDFDHNIIDYAMRKWRKSRLPAEFHILLQNAKFVDDKLVLEFLKLWLY